MQDVAAQVGEARLGYDLAAAAAVFAEAVTLAEGSPSEETNLLLGRAAVLLAELRRFDYEEKDHLRPLERRLLGREVDAAAKVGHNALDAVEDCSEKYRMKADLWATMIRSSYKGKKYENEMENAKERALALDPRNPKAHITAAKRPLFAPVKRGGDLDLAMMHLNTALKLDPECEMGLIFRGIAYDKQDNRDSAIKDWKRAVELNPSCRPAKENIERLEGGG